MSSKFRHPILLDGLSSDLVVEVLNAGKNKRYSRGEMIQWEGDDGNLLQFILSGSVELFRMSPSGREQTIRRLSAGELFNLAAALIPDGYNPVSVRALVDCEIAIMDEQKLLQLMKAHPEFSVRVAQYLSRRLLGMTDLVEQLSLHPVRQRLAAFLMDQAEKPQLLNWTQDEIAKRLGTVREVVSRTLREFSHEGLIRMDRNRIELLDKEVLRKTSKGLE